jgi:KDO2-lipid IV(A) lauroyltransferase
MAFPYRPEKEINKIAKEYYKHLADVMVESFKGLSMSKRSVIRRHKIVNPEILDKYFNQNISVIGVSGHYGNWEWGTASSGLQVKHRVIGFYQPLTNAYFEKYIRINRGKFSTQMVSIRETFETFKINEGKACAYLMIADQSPSNLEKSYWIDFMGIETPFLHGPEKYARMYNLPVIYIDIKPIKRGFYELELIPVTEKPLEFGDGELTKMFAQMLEERINKNPRYWIWSHRRWKNAKLKNKAYSC